MVRKERNLFLWQPDAGRLVLVHNNPYVTLAIFYEIYLLKVLVKVFTLVRSGSTI